MLTLHSNKHLWRLDGSHEVLLIHTMHTKIKEHTSEPITLKNVSY